MSPVDSPDCKTLTHPIEPNRFPAAIPQWQSEARCEQIVANNIAAIYRYLCSPDGSQGFVYISAGCEEIYEIAADQIVQNAQLVWSLIHPEDRREFEEAMTAALICLTPWWNEHRLITPSGQLKWLRFSLQPKLQADGTIVCDGMILDISDRKRQESERKQAEQALMKRERYLSTLVEIQQRLLALNSSEGNFYNHVLEPLGKAAEADRVYVFENSWNGQGQFCTSQKAEWCAAGIPAQIDNPDLQNMPYAEFVPRWLTLLGQGGIVAGQVADFPLQERVILEPQGIVSLLVLPLFVHHQFFGFIGFDNCKQDRLWEPSDIDLLQAAAAAISLSLERQQANAQLVTVSLRDALTSLPNRTLLFDRLEHALQRYQRHPQQQFAVLFLDMDRFKSINDSLGHTAGDQVLLEMAHRLSQSVREEDTVARLGGDEFVILLEEVMNLQDALHCAQRIQDILAVPFELNGTVVSLDASIGVALADARYHTPEELLRDADIAMYEAKAAGRGGYQVFAPQMHEQAKLRLQKEQDLRLALRKEQFQVVYQPIVNLLNHALLGFEALIRWQHPQGVQIPVPEFLTIADQLGLLVKLEWWVLQTACEQLAQWQSLPGLAGRPLSVSVNVSSTLFAQPNLVPEVARLIQQFKLPPQGLKLEITEGVIGANADVALENGQALQSLGVQLHIDDFGTGYSSLKRLHQFPVHALKIDRSFVRHLDQSSENREIVRAIVSLANTLGIDVIAEGIETEQQCHYLQTLACQQGQGYWFAPPLTTAEVEQMLLQIQADHPWGLKPGFLPRS
uniref:Diguanylate cyclase/phosphodiesterase with PAS/PAC and GAF sensor(S) n=1 Tax=Cyanothece sp. (strain PCC 7425 / ATCC 29141) TaxID=395961 RepID=B8HMI3_CYAP4